MSINLIQHGWDAVKIKNAEYEKLAPGAYVCSIVEARTSESPLKGCMLICDIDISEGEKKDFFYKRLPKTGDWDFNAVFKRYVYKNDGKITPAFKGFIGSLQAQNPNFKFDPNNFEPSSLKGLTCGFSFGEREYMNSSGEIKTSVSVRYHCDAEKVRRGEVKTPEIEKYDHGVIDDKKNNFSDIKLSDVPDSDMPF